jgi:hypothetical protein
VDRRASDHAGECVGRIAEREGARLDLSPLSLTQPQGALRGLKPLGLASEDLQQCVDIVEVAAVVQNGESQRVDAVELCCRDDGSAVGVERLEQTPVEVVCASAGAGRIGR